MSTPSWHGSNIFVLVPIEEISYFERFIPKGISIFGLREVSQHAVFAVNQTFEAFACDAAPSSCLAMAAVGEDGLARLHEARDLFARWSGGEFIHTLQIKPSEAAQAIPSLLLTRVLDRFRSVSKQCVTYAGDLARLRASHEELHNNFAALEAFVVSSNVQPIKLIFNNPPVPGSFLDIEGLKEVSQVLPTSTFALSSVDIYLGELTKANKRCGGLEIDFVTLEENQILARWHLNADQIAEGWTNLDFVKTLRGHQRTGRLAIRTIGGIGDMPPLGLGSPQSLKTFRVQVAPQGSYTPNASLALRCWSGLPGIAPPNISKSISFTPFDSASAIRRVAIPFTLLQAVEWIKTYWNPEVAPVGFKVQDRAVKCNPPPKGVTLAKLPEISLPEISRIEAHAFVQGHDASPVEFAVLFSDLPAKKIATMLLRGQTAKADFFFSGWVKCVAGRPVYISSVVPVANMTGCIFLATRIPAESSRNTTRAEFRDLQITLLGLSNPDQSQVKPLNSEIKTIEASKSCKRILLAEDLQRARGTNGTKASQVRFDRTNSEIKCELVDDQHLIAVIPNVRVKDPIQLSIKAGASCSNKAAISVGVGVSDFGVREDIVLRQLNKPTVATTRLAFSGWHKIRPAEDATFEIDIKGRSDFVSLYLLAQAEACLESSIAEFSNICILERKQSNGSRE
jgi:hypothetical protein